MSTAAANTPTSASASDGAEVAVLTARGVRESRPASSIRTHDFRQSGFLAPSELRRIRLRHEQFIRALAARLAIFLRLEVSVQLDKMQILGYQQFSELLASPTHITLFRTDPLKGVGLLVIPPRLGLGLVDRLLGGAGQMPETGRDLSEIETALADQIATLVLAEWCNHWPEMRDLRPAVLGHENNSRFLRTSLPDTAMLVMTIQAGISGSLEPVQLAFPYATIEPLVRLLTPAALAEPEPAPAIPAKPVWNTDFDELDVNASAQWHGLRISAMEIARLKPGDVLMLAPGCAGQVELRLSQTPKFLGRPGICGGKWAVQLTAALPD
jgi:flagellar motor switch protein FliM